MALGILPHFRLTKTLLFYKPLINMVRFVWLRGQDLNLLSSGYEPDELPGCSTPRHASFAGISVGFSRERWADIGHRLAPVHSAIPTAAYHMLQRSMPLGPGRPKMGMGLRGVACSSATTGPPLARKRLCAAFRSGCSSSPSSGWTWCGRSW